MSLGRNDIRLIEKLFDFGENCPSTRQKAAIAADLRGASEENSRLLDMHMLSRLEQTHNGLAEARNSLTEIEKVIEKLSAPPLHPAVFMGPIDTPGGLRAWVAQGHSHSIVDCGDDVAPDSLAAGDWVLLSNERNVILAHSPYSLQPFGETALFEQIMPDGRLLLTSRDEPIVVPAAAALAEGRLNQGDMVMWDRACGMAFEKIDQPKGEGKFLEETPSETFADIGGLDSQIERLQSTIALSLYHKEIVERYQLPLKRSAILHGPPGTGKTMIARAFANWTGQLSESGRSIFMNIKPSSTKSFWYGLSEAKIREIFRIARQRSEEQPDVAVTMFFDEVDSIASRRGESLMNVDDRVSQALMAELDGFESRGNVFVLCATNRLDALDPAFVRPGRLGDDVIHIPRPNMSAARDIFTKHLPAQVPYAQDGHDPDQAAQRDAIINAAVSKLYSSGDDEGLAVITFRDGKKQTVRAADLMSGALIAKIAQSALERACTRQIETGREGLQMNDILTSIADRTQEAAGVLTARNCRAYLADLPQDVDVVSVQPTIRKVRHPHRYLNWRVA